MLCGHCVFTPAGAENFFSLPNHVHSFSRQRCVPSVNPPCLLLHFPRDRDLNALTWTPSPIKCTMFYRDPVSLHFHNSCMGLLFHAGWHARQERQAPMVSFPTDKIRISCSIILHLGTPKVSACVNGQEMHILPQAWRDIWCLKTTEKTDITSYIAGKYIHDYVGLCNV